MRHIMLTEETDITYFVPTGSIVRKIWGRSETVLFIFAGAAAEFSLNKSVDWLYFTGKLPHDPIGRLFSTVSYARKIIFFKEKTALGAIDKMRQVHTTVEGARGISIPEWAYRDVLYMLIYCSITSFELLERRLTKEEKEEVFRVFITVGQRMGLTDLPITFDEWVADRRKQLVQDIEKSNFTLDLYKQYRKHLGLLRYIILLKVQGRIAPEEVRRLLGLKSSAIVPAAVWLYKIVSIFKMDQLLKPYLLPLKYKRQFMEMEKGET